MNEPSIPHDEEATTHELVTILLTSGDEDEVESGYWKAMSTLHQRGTREVFEAARSLCESECPLEQRVGCDIVAQLGCPDRPFASESFALVASVLHRTDNVDTLANALCALGWLGDRRGVDLVLPYLDHADSDIRYWVTHALSAMHEDPRSIAGLIRLTNDPRVAIRDWATFGLGSQTEQDTPLIREALLARLADTDAVVRGEALVGLAKRQDERVIEPLQRALESGTYDKEISDYAGEALDELRDSEKYPQLLKWKANA
jgi:HEAT repeat protein